MARARAAHPGRPVEVWAEDEHRLGLKPVRRRVWAPIGERPIALGHHRYQWLHVTAFVQPTSGEAVWFLSTGLSKPLFDALLASFARRTGAGRARHIVLVLDNAGWHGPEGLTVPEGITLVFLPPYSPELQPAECSPLSGCGPWWTSRLPTATSPLSPISTPPSPSAVAVSTPPASARTPTSTGGPSRFSRTNQPEFV